MQCTVWHSVAQRELLPFGLLHAAWKQRQWGNTVAMAHSSIAQRSLVVPLLLCVRLSCERTNACSVQGTTCQVDLCERDTTIVIHSGGRQYRETAMPQRAYLPPIEQEPLRAHVVDYKRPAQVDVPVCDHTVAEHCVY